MLCTGEQGAAAIETVGGHTVVCHRYAGGCGSGTRHLDMNLLCPILLCPIMSCCPSVHVMICNMMNVASYNKYVYISHIYPAFPVYSTKTTHTEHQHKIETCNTVKYD